MRINGIPLARGRAPSWLKGQKPAESPDAASISTKLREITNFGDNPGALRMFAYAPSSLAEKAPLVVILHGCGQTAADYEAGTGWVELADALGFAVLAPEQTRTNNANNCFNWFQPFDVTRGQGEVASIRQMIEKIVVDHALDRHRVFITGLSAGGAMAVAMLATYPDIFSGGAIIAGVAAGAASNVAEALSVMRNVPDKTAQEWGDFVRKSSGNRGPWPSISILHGDADNIVTRDNADALIAQWTNVHGLPRQPSQTETKGNSHHRIWQRHDGGIAIEAFDIAGMGHGVPLGGSPEYRYGKPGPYFLEVGLSSTIHIAAFWGFDVKQAKKIPHQPNTKPGWFSADTIYQKQPSRLESVIRKALRPAGIINT